jgi:hypothetical protein
MVAPIAILLLFVGFGAIVGLIVLLANPRTRPVGLTILAAVVLLVVLGWFWLGAGAPSYAPLPSGLATVRQTPSATVPSAPVPPDAIGSAREQGSAADKAPPRGGVLSAIGHALADVLPHSVRPPTVEVSGNSKPSPPAARAAPPAAGRPDWVDAAPHYADNAYVMSIPVGPFETREQCEAEVPQALQEAVERYAAIYVGAGAAGRWDWDPADLRRRLLREEWQEPVETSFGPMVVLHLRLAFDRQMQEGVQAAVRREATAGRLRVAAIGLGGVLLALAVVFACLKWVPPAGRRQREGAGVASQRGAAAGSGFSESVQHPTAAAESGPRAGFPTLFIIAMVLTGALLAAVLTTRGAFMRIFADFGTVLPNPTVVLGSTLFAWIVGAVFVLTIAKEILVNSEATRATWNRTAIRAVVLLGVLYAAAMFLPLTAVIRNLSR